MTRKFIVRSSFLIKILAIIRPPKRKHLLESCGEMVPGARALDPSLTSYHELSRGLTIRAELLRDWGVVYLNLVLPFTFKSFYQLWKLITLYGTSHPKSLSVQLRTWISKDYRSHMGVSKNVLSPCYFLSWGRGYGR